MKSLLLFLIFIIFQVTVTAQDCMSSEYLKKGTKWEVTNLNKKGKATSTAKYEVLNTNHDSNQKLWEINVVVLDKKNNPVNEGSTEITCENGIYKMDMSQALSAETMQSIQSMEAEIESSPINYPTNKDVNAVLEDATIIIATSAGMGVMDLKLSITNRKIQGLETITTEAGTFECLKITEDTKIENKFFNRKYSTVSWFLPSFGVVKSESYNHKDQLMGGSVLSSLTR
ncbi:MAG TPA: hypothetical protein VKY37_10450 [Brumimicrobium sp.]|nr:hypothetical protein [Brumimicrobium sp.]